MKITPQPWFAHVDMDAFYASVEVLDYPELAGLPLAVGGPAEGRGVIAAASYEARRFGVRSAMPTAEALRRCPQLILRKGRMGRYQEKSREVLAILAEISPRLETISLDEAFLDLAGCERLHAPWDAFALRVRRRIHDETGLWCSIGIGETRRIAKIASDLRKPRGLVVVERGAGIGFLAPLPVERLWGVGPRMAERLHAEGFDTVGQLAQQSSSGLQSRFGKMGISLHEMSMARELGAVTIAIVTKPFGFEGNRRQRQALEGITVLRDAADTVISIPNDRLLEVVERNASVVEAFQHADDILRQGVQGVTDLITVPGLINLDFADVRTIVKDAGTALLGIGVAAGENRAQAAADMAIHSPLLETSIDGASGLLLNITGGEDLTLYEVNEAAGVISEAADDDANIIFGAVVDEKLEGKIAITVVATGFGDEVWHAQAPARVPESRAPAPKPEPREERGAPFGPAPRFSEHDFDIPSFVNQPED